MQADPLAPQRGPVMGRHAMVVTDHPTATERGLAILRSGGNAFDAAVAISMLLAVLKPSRCQVGGDVFYLVYEAESGRITALNGSGVAPTGATPSAYADGIPDRGIRAAAVPGFVDGVCELHKRFARRPFEQLVAPAIELARDGFPLSLRLAENIAEFSEALSAFPATAAIFLPGGRCPAAGEILRQPELAGTLEAIAGDGRDAFYRGPFASALLDYSRNHGGHFEADDLAAHWTEVREPISTSYRGLTVYEQPPVSQGHILLEELAILDGFDLDGRSPSDVIHLMVEAKKLAFADRAVHAGDPRHGSFAAERLLDHDFIAERRAQIDPLHAADEPSAGRLDQQRHDTTSFAVVDAAGNAVAAIQSVFQAWGSGVIVDGTGVLLNNRLCGFNLEAGHPNALSPGKRTVHTLNNYLISAGGRLVLVGGTPGAQQQVQTNMQVISAVIDRGFDVQTALDLPRWGHTAGVALTLERRFDAAVAAQLERRGHRIRWTQAWDGTMGRAAVICRLEGSGVLMGAMDLRGEGSAAGW